MYTLYCVSVGFTGVFGFCFAISLAVTICEDFDNVKANVFMFITALLLTLSIVGIVKTCEEEEVIENTYKIKLKAISNAQNELEMFLIDYPQFRE